MVYCRTNSPTPGTTIGDIMARYTNEDFARVLDHLKVAMRLAGVTRTVRTHPTYVIGVGDQLGSDFTFTADHIKLDKGSPTYGRAWRIWFVHPESGAQHETPFGSYLGSTSTEAMRSLSSLWQGIYAASTAAEVHKETLNSIAEVLASNEPGSVWKYDRIVQLMASAGLVSHTVDGIKVL